MPFAKQCNGLRIDGQPIKSGGQNRELTLAKGTTPSPSVPQGSEGLYLYKGFHFLIAHIEGRFEAFILNNGKPVRVHRCGRNSWRIKKHAMNSAKQFIRKKLLTKVAVASPQPFHPSVMQLTPE